MDDVCEQLDKIVLQVFQVMEDFYSNQHKLEQVMRDGYFGISRSRYMLGIKRVSADQILDTELTAKYRTACESPGKSVEDLSVKSEEHSIVCDDFSRLTLIEPCNMTEEVLESDNVEKILSDKDSDEKKELRRRRVNVEENKDATAAKDQELDDKEDNNKDTGSKDLVGQSSRSHNKNRETQASKKEKTTLSLFGVLIPQPLRQSQKCFEEAVKISVSQADLRVKLSLLQKKYRQLCDKKQQLQDVSAEQ